MATGLALALLHFSSVGLAAEDLRLLARDVVRFAISPDGQWVAYATWDESGVDLRSVHLGSWIDRPVYKGLDPFGETWSTFGFAPDGEFLVYPVHELVTGPSRLMSFELTEPSGRSVVLYDTSPASGGPINWSPTSDGRYIVYLTATELQELFAVPVEGPSASAWRLNSQFPDFGDVWNYVLAADGQSVFYSGDQAVRDEYGIWMARLDAPGSPPVQVSAIPPTSGPLPQCVNLAPGSVDPAGSVVLHDCGLGWQTDLYASDANGGEQSRLLHDAFGNQYLESYRFSPDGEWALFELGGLPLEEIFRVPIGGPASASQLVTTDGPGVILDNGWSVTPDSSRLLYLRLGQWPFHDLYSARLYGQPGGSVRLNPPTDPLDGVLGYIVAPDSQSVVFGLSDEQGFAIGYRSPVDGAGPAIPLWTEQCQIDGSRKWIDLVGAGEFAVVRCARETPFFPSLSLVRIRVEPDPSLLPLLPPDLFLSYLVETPSDFAVSTDGKWLVFLARSEEGPHVIDLYARQLPLFRDGFESGTFLNWSSAQNP